MDNKYRRPYPSSGSEYHRARTSLARYANPEDRSKPLKVWVRCCNKMHPIVVSGKGRLSVPAHPNIKAERMMIRMGAKEPRCLQILRLWKGDLLRKDSDGVGHDYNFHKKLQKHIPDELLRAYCGGLKHRDATRMDTRRKFVTPILQDEITWYDSDSGGPKGPWLNEVLPQMAVERLLMRELMGTPKIVEVLKGRKLEAYSFGFSQDRQQDNDNYFGGIHFSIMVPWYEEKNLRVNANLDLSFVGLAMSDSNRTKEGDLIVGRFDAGSPRYQEIQGKIKASPNKWSGPGCKYVVSGEKDIYIGLTYYNRDVNNNDREVVESQLGVLGEEREWLWLKQT